MHIHNDMIITTERHFMLSFLQSINQFLWGIPALILLFGTHLYFSFHLKFVQRLIGRGLKYSVSNDPTASNSRSCFSALATTLAATLGTGNIIGISTAVALGGPGAILWCWLTGILGMATSYAESYLSMLFRKQTPSGSYYGGPMYVLRDGMHAPFLAGLYAFCVIAASFGTGCTTQSSSMSLTLHSLWNIPPVVSGIVISLLIGFLLQKGFKNAENLCQRLVPFMSFLFVFFSLLLLLKNYAYLLPAIRLIFKDAFSFSSINGGFTGAALRYGISRGLFTNEAGLGSAAIAAASSRTNDFKRQALVSMSATFLDTVVLCALTGILIVANMLHNPASLQDKNIGELTHAAFEMIPFGNYLIGICLLLFAFATLLGWSYFGQQAFLFLFKKKHLNYYHLFYMAAIFSGAVLSLNFIWELTDFLNILMVIPNLICLFHFRHKIKSPTKF